MPLCDECERDEHGVHDNMGKCTRCDKNYCCHFHHVNPCECHIAIIVIIINDDDVNKSYPNDDDVDDDAV